MKAIRYTAALLMMAISAVSCIKEDAPYKNNNGVKKGMGILELDVNADVPEKTTKALHEVTDYPVTITDKATNTIVGEWQSVAEVPAKVELPLGTYVIESHTQGNIQKKMSAPYYSGAKDIEIVQYHTTEAEVICKMLNSKISVVYDPLFTETFKSWSITLNEGLNTVTTLTHTSDEAENVFYWYFQSNVSVIRMDFTGVIKEDDRTIHQTIEITKDKAEHGGYDNDKDTHFTGGDALTFTLKPMFDDKGEIGPITVIPSIDFTDDGNPDDFVVEVEDVTEGGEEGGGESGEEGGGESGGTGDPDNIILNIPDPINLDVYFDDEESFDLVCRTDPSEGDVSINAVKGIKSLIVKVSSDNAEFISTVDLLPKQYPSITLVQGCEVVGNKGLENFLSAGGTAIPVPDEGDNTYTFPVGLFFSLLTSFDGTHNFEMTVTDMEGAVKSGTVIITVPYVE